MKLDQTKSEFVAPYIKEARVTAAHEGIAEMVVQIEYENGGTTEVSLDHYAVERLLQQADVNSIDELIGQSWELVRDALSASYNRF